MLGKIASEEPADESTLAGMARRPERLAWPFNFLKLPSPDHVGHHGSQIEIQSETNIIVVCELRDRASESSCDSRPAQAAYPTIRQLLQVAVDAQARVTCKR